MDSDYSHDYRQSHTLEAQFELHRTLTVTYSPLQQELPTWVPSGKRYTYEPLQSDRDFRCFDLLPGRWGNPIVGNLIHIPVETETAYEAVSYAWGRQEATVVIGCNAGTLTVSSNLAVMLRRLRYDDRPRLLWIDAICINQTDRTERASQVQHMDRIYRQASQMTIWWGEEDELTPLAFDLLTDLDLMMQRLPHRDYHTSWPTYTDLRTQGLPAADDHRWRALEWLLHDRWMLRTWVLQEVALASNPWVQRGSFVCDWKKLIGILHCLRLSGIDNQYNLKLTAVSRVMQFCFQAAQESQRPTLLDLVHMARESCSSKEVDKVFGLLGLAADREQMQALVDYTRPPRDVYIDFAKSYLDRGDLRVLSLAKDSSFGHLKGLPTWVPNWTGTSGTSPWITVLPYLKAPPSNSVQKGSPLKVPTVCHDGLRLSLRGRVTDRVASIGNHFPLSRRTDRELAVLYLEQWRRLAKRYGRGRACMTDDVIDETFAALVGMQTNSQVVEGARSSEVYFQYIEQFATGRQWASRIHEDEPYSKTWKFHERVLDACTLRSFFITRTGRLGLGPFFLRPDDHIVWFDGGLLPFAVRRASKGAYKLVGDLYIAGGLDSGKDLSGLNEDIHLV